MKVATLDLSPELFIEFCKASKWQEGHPRRFVVKENPLPDDAEIVSVGLARSDWVPPFTLRLFIRSNSFADVPEGGHLPELPLVVYETVYEKAA